MSDRGLHIFSWCTMAWYNLMIHFSLLSLSPPILHIHAHTHTNTTSFLCLHIPSCQEHKTDSCWKVSVAFLRHLCDQFFCLFLRVEVSRSFLNFPWLKWLFPLTGSIAQMPKAFFTPVLLVRPALLSLCGNTSEPVCNAVHWADKTLAQCNSLLTSVTEISVLVSHDLLFLRHISCNSTLCDQKVISCYYDSYRS